MALKELKNLSAFSPALQRHTFFTFVKNFFLISITIFLFFKSNM